MAGCDGSNLLIDGPWKWLIQKFALLFHVSVPYTLMAHLRWVLKPGIASMTTRCFRIIGLLMAQLLQQEREGTITQEEVSPLRGRNLPSREGKIALGSIT
jgi:hypothetical protein